jgi:hypothetical protein
MLPGGATQSKRTARHSVLDPDRHHAFSSSFVRVHHAVARRRLRLAANALTPAKPEKRAELLPGPWGSFSIRHDSRFCAMRSS